MTLRSLSVVALVLAAAASPALAARAGSYSVSVLIDGVEAPEYAAKGRIYLEALKGRNFSIRLANPTSERVAVALSVDGRDVIDAKRTTAEKAAKWILMPGQVADIPGWQVSGDTSRRFFFTDTRRSYAKWLGDTANVGTIEAVFYRERRSVAASPRWPRPLEERTREAVSDAEARPAPSRPNDAVEGGVVGGVEGGVPAGPDRKMAKSGEPALTAPSSSDRAAGAMTRRQESDAYAATGIGDRTRFSVEWINFDEEPSPAARIALRYEFHAELVRLGVLFHEDDLYARDRGRGFERDYAPDPYRHR